MGIGCLTGDHDRRRSDRPPARGLVIGLWVAAAVAGMAFTCTASAEISYFPIPSVSTSRNDGNDAGFIVPTLVTKPDGDLQYIVAPMFVVNSIVGARGAINVFRYEPGGRQLRFIASLTERIERKLVLSYTDPAFSNGRYAFTVGGSFFKNATSRFFGIGESTPLSNETNYTAREARAEWKFGVYLNEVSQIAVGERFREVGIQPGGTNLPFSRNVFPTVVGINGGTIMGHRVTFHYDSRDNLVTPTAGAQATVYAEVNNNFRSGDHPVYFRYGGEIKKLFPSESKHMTLVFRAEIQTTFGQDVPFFERSSLGGQNNLRGYGVDRFIDNHLIAVSIEQRIHILRIRVAGVAPEFQLAPFIDTGKVFSSFSTLHLNDYRVTPGIGFRGIVRPSVVGRVDYGYSREGGAVFAGLDFPF